MPLQPHLQLPNPGSSGVSTPSPVYFKEGAANTSSSSLAPKGPIPFKCFAFIINNALIYMSDVSNIPDDAWSTILHPPSPSNEKVDPEYQALLIDVLRPEPFVSHFGLDQAISAARRIGAKRNYGFGFTHELNHEQWVRVGEGVGVEENKTPITDSFVREALDMVTTGPAVWFRPAFDGLRIVVPEKGDPEGVLVDGYSA